MASRTKAITLAHGGDQVTLELPAYAVRYLKSMCARERLLLDKVGAFDTYAIGLDSAYDALKQIEAALP